MVLSLLSGRSYETEICAILLPLRYNNAFARYRKEHCVLQYFLNPDDDDSASSTDGGSPVIRANQHKRTRHSLSSLLTKQGMHWLTMCTELGLLDCNFVM